MIEKESVKLHELTFDLFIDKKEIKKRVQEMAEQINQDYAGRQVVVLGVLDGVFMVLSDLLKKLDISVSLEMVKLKSYQGENSTGKVHKLLGLNSNLKDLDVLVVEDIIDTGTTLGFLLDLLKTHQPKSIKIATLLLKKEIYHGRYPLDYIGFSIPNRFVVGYGMDYDGLGRQLPHIYAVQGQLQKA